MGDAVSACRVGKGPPAACPAPAAKPWHLLWPDVCVRSTRCLHSVLKTAARWRATPIMNPSDRSATGVRLASTHWPIRETRNPACLHSVLVDRRSPHGYAWLRHRGRVTANRYGSVGNANGSIEQPPRSPFSMSAFGVGGAGRGHSLEHCSGSSRPYQRLGTRPAPPSFGIDRPLAAARGDLSHDQFTSSPPAIRDTCNLQQCPHSVLVAKTAGPRLLPRPAAVRSDATSEALAILSPFAVGRTPTMERGERLA